MKALMKVIRETITRGLRDYPHCAIWLYHISFESLRRAGEAYPCCEEQVDKRLG
jgi:hypothetical protein